MLVVIEERVRFARRRFGHYDVIDFVVVLLGYAISGERTLEAFYECVHPFVALFGRERLPPTARRFFAALDQAPVEALCAVFLARPVRSVSGEGRKNGRAVGSAWNPLADIRCGWHTPSCPSACFALYP